MLKSMLLASVRPFYDAEKEGKSEADKQRESIKVVNNTEGEKEEKEEEKIEGEEVEKEEETEKEENEDDDTEKEEKEEVELTADQKAIKKLEKTVERLQKRVGRTTGERDTVKKELDAAKAALALKVEEGTQPLTEEEVERRAEAKANEKVTEAEFNRTQTKLIKEATAISKDFMDKVNEMAKEVAPLPPFFIGALGDLDNGGAVLNYLTDNVEEYEEIFNIGSASKVVKKLVEISNKLMEEAKPKPKKISKVPPPNETIKGSQGTPNIITGKETQEEFNRIRAQQVEERRKARMR